MTDVYRFNEGEILLFFTLVVRMSAFVVSWPVFGVENVSQKLKILFALCLAMVVFPTLKLTPAQAATLDKDLILVTIREAFIGVSLGYLARMFFFTFRIAGDLLSQSMGLSSAQTFNPLVGGQSTPVEHFYVTLASLFYLGVNGHHLLISGLVQSLDWCPLATLKLNTSQFIGMGHLVQEVVELGLKFSAPVVISILAVNLTLGVVGKTVPQLNVLVTGFPINILIGFILLVITLPMLLDQMGPYLNLSTTRVFQFVKAY